MGCTGPGAYPTRHQASLQGNFRRHRSVRPQLTVAPRTQAPTHRRAPVDSLLPDTLPCRRSLRRPALTEYPLAPIEETKGLKDDAVAPGKGGREVPSPRRGPARPRHLAVAGRPRARDAALHTRKVHPATGEEPPDRALAEMALVFRDDRELCWATRLLWRAVNSRATAALLAGLALAAAFSREVVYAAVRGPEGPDHSFLTVPVVLPVYVFVFLVGLAFHAIARRLLPPESVLLRRYLRRLFWAEAVCAGLPIALAFVVVLRTVSARAPPPPPPGAPPAPPPDGPPAPPARRRGTAPGRSSRSPRASPTRAASRSSTPRSSSSTPPSPGWRPCRSPSPPS